MATDLAIDIGGIEKTYKGARTLRQALRHPFKRHRLDALAGVSLQAPWGQMRALVGPNGAGKTTLLKILCTLLLPEKGHARVAGYDTAKESRRVRAATGLVVSDERSFYWRLTGRHNLEFFAALHNMTLKQARQRTSEVAELLGLTEHLDRPFREYSTGMRQKLAICRGIIHRPRVLLLDEPTRGIDLEALRSLRTYLREFVSDGGTALIASHDLAEIEALDCTVSLLDKGKILGVGTARELKKQLGIADEYLLDLDRLPPSRPEVAGIQKWMPQGEHTRVHVTLKPEAAIGEVIAALAGIRVTVQTCTPAGGDLEAVLDARRELEAETS